jgi:hypothetical protein
MQNENKTIDTNDRTINTTFNVVLDVNEINFVLQTLGELPTKSGVWPLLLKIKEQADTQISKT